MGNRRGRGTFYNIGFWFYEAGKKIGAHVDRIFNVSILIIFYFVTIIAVGYNETFITANPGQATAGTPLGDDVKRVRAHPIGIRDILRRISKNAGSTLSLYRRQEVWKVSVLLPYRNDIKR
jgi:hypothetical protein